MVAQIGMFKILVVLTSAMFAIAQYYDSRQRKLMKDEQDKLWKLDFPGSDTNDGMKDVEKIGERIKNKDPLGNQKIIIALWFFIVYYTLLVALKMLAPYLTKIQVVSKVLEVIGPCLDFLLTIPAVCLFITSIFLTIRLAKMKAQELAFRDEIANFHEMYEAVKKSMKVNDTSPTS